MRLRTRLIWPGAALLAVLLAASLWLLRKPDCSCYFPTERTYGVLSATGTCQAKPCLLSPELEQRISQRLKELMGSAETPAKP